MLNDVHLKEFEKLKDEQIDRLSYRDNLFYLTLVIIGGGIAAAYSNRDALLILLLLPVAIFVAGISHITCDRRIQDIGLYIKEHLSKNITHSADEPGNNIFGWESYFRDTLWHRTRKKLQLVANLLLYFFSGLGLIGIYWWKCNEPAHKLSGVEITVCTFDLFLMLVMCWLILRFATINVEPARNEGSPAPRHGHALIRTVLAAVAATAAAVAVVHFGPHVLPDPNHSYSFAPIGLTDLYLTRTHIAAALAALLVWAIGISLGKR
jgi:hypothetical protein